MDPPLFNEGSFSAANASLAEIWPLGFAGLGGVGGVVGLRMGNGGFGHGLVDGLLVDSGGMNRDCSIDCGGSAVTEQSESLGGRKRRRDALSEYASSKHGSTIASSNELGINVEQVKPSGPREENGSSNARSESWAGDGKPAEKSNQQVKPPKDYIYVRARRGQATDSHTLAERARREKISERMKILQDLVPGCNKVISKALVLDEIINYIQSLHRQVEFLSMKLEAFNSGMAPSIARLITKEIFDPRLDAAGILHGSETARECVPTQAVLFHMQLVEEAKELP